MVASVSGDGIWMTAFRYAQQKRIRGFHRLETRAHTWSDAYRVSSRTVCLYICFDRLQVLVRPSNSVPYLYIDSYFSSFVSLYSWFVFVFHLCILIYGIHTYKPPATAPGKGEIRENRSGLVAVPLRVSIISLFFPCWSELSRSIRALV